MKKLTILILTLIVSFQIYSQEDRIEIDGKIIADSLTVENIHIVNLTTKQGTISNNDGSFKIYATVSDTLFISSLLFKKKYQLITKQNIVDKIIYISVLSQTNLLNEVVLNNHNLSGSLVLDTKNTPKDSIRMNPMTIDFSNINWDIPLEEDEMSRKKMPNSYAYGGGINIFGIIGLAIDLLSDKDKQRTKKIVREREAKKAKEIKVLDRQLPSLLKSELGISFYVKNLKIPEDEIYNFIEYCYKRNIIELYQQDKKLKVIEILIEESNNYNALKKVKN